MKRLSYAAALAAIALAAQGCAEMKWTKPGADANAVANDQNECRAVALGATPPVGTRGTIDTRADGGRSPVMASSSSSGDRFVAEHEEMSRCMTQRGYQLKPAS
jgi:hypothetical protein